MATGDLISVEACVGFNRDLMEVSEIVMIFFVSIHSSGQTISSSPAPQLGTGEEKYEDTESALDKGLDGLDKGSERYLLSMKPWAAYKNTLCFYRGATSFCSAS
jgi:hypothetical protein